MSTLFFGSAAGDQRPHAGVGAGEVAGPEVRLEEGVDRVQQVLHVGVGDLAGARGSPRSRCRSSRPGSGPSHGSAKIVRPSPGRQNSRRVHRQPLAVEQDVGAAARADHRHVLLAVQLLGADAVRPHAGRVHDVRGRDGEALAASPAPRTRRPPPCPPSSISSTDRRPVDAHGPEALGLAEHRQDEPRVVGLAVVEEVRGGGVARLERAGPAPAPRRGRSCGGGRGSSTRRPPAPPRAAARRRARGLRSDITSYMFSPTPMRRSRRAPSNAGTRNGSGFTRCGASRTISWRSTQRLAHEAEVEVLQVAQAAVDHLRRAARGAAGEVVALDERDREPARGRVEARRRRP